MYGYIYPLYIYMLYVSVQFCRSVVSDSLRPCESQHARPPCPSPTPGVHSDSRPSSQWCHPAISSSVVPFSSCPQSLPAAESFPIYPFYYCARRISVSLATWVLLPEVIFFYPDQNLWPLKGMYRRLPWGPVVKNLPSSAWNVCLIPAQGTKIPHAVGQPSLYT